MNSKKESICCRVLTSGIDKYNDYIIKSMLNGSSKKQLYNELQNNGLNYSKLTAYNYFNQISKLYNSDFKNNKHFSQKKDDKTKEKYIYVSRKSIFDYIFFNKAIRIEQKCIDYLIKTYPVLLSLKVCVKEFKKIFDNGYHSLLYSFINKYLCSDFPLLSSFAKGLYNDLSAVENAVSSELSNGFVEGTNNKLKMIKRTMYVRCHLTLLAAKLII